MEYNKTLSAPLEIHDSERSYYIDFCKGICAIAVIFIHVTFWSGANYVPGWVRNVSLLLDVPLFFFLSGWGTAMSRELNWSRTLNSCLDLFLKYFFFTMLYYGMYLIYHKIRNPEWSVVIQDFAQMLTANFTFTGGSLPNLQLVMSSMWFMPVYLAVRSLAVGVLYLMSNSTHSRHNATVLLVLCVIGLNFSLNGANFYNLSRNMLFYSILFLLGYVLKGKIFTFRGFALAIAGLIIGMLFLKITFRVSFTSIQGLKFPPQPGYLLYSGLSIAVCLLFAWFKPKKTNVLVVIGKNCLWFFFAQGLSGAAVIALAPLIRLPWQLKLAICFTINLVLAVVIAFILERLWYLFGKLKILRILNIKVFYEES